MYREIFTMMYENKQEDISPSVYLIKQCKQKAWKCNPHILAQDLVRQFALLNFALLFPVKYVYIYG